MLIIIIAMVTITIIFLMLSLKSDAPKKQSDIKSRIEVATTSPAKEIAVSRRKEKAASFRHTISF